MDPLISVIVPVYNVEQYLPRCLDSILSQTYTNLEVILVDDGSPDHCGAICDAYAQKDSRVRVVHQQNAGIGRTRNVGLALCTGDYLTFVDSDDILYPDAIRQLYDRARYDCSDMVIANYVRLYEDGSASAPFHDFSDSALTKKELLDLMSVFVAVPFCSWGKLYSRACMEGIEYPPVRVGEDTLIFPQVVDRCTCISTVSAPLYAYFQRENSLMRELRSEQTKTEDLHAILYTARYLWDNDCHRGAANWYAAAVKNALTVRNRRERLAAFDRFFDRRIRMELQKRLDRKCQIAWLCLHIPLADRLFCRRLSKNTKKA